MTSLNHDFNISSSCLAGNNHVLPHHLPNPVHFLSIRRVYFHSNAANHPAKAKASMFDTDVGSNSRSALALIGREAHVSSTHARGISPVEIPRPMFSGIPFTASRELFYACVR